MVRTLRELFATGVRHEVTQLRERAADRRTMTRIDAVLDHPWCSPINVLELELSIVSWLAAARHPVMGALWPLIVEHIEQSIHHEKHHAQA